VRSLSARRRHPLAGYAVLALGLLLAGGAYALLLPSAGASTSTSDLISQGRQLFLVQCASCHGKNAEGTLNKMGTNYGPPLIGVGAAAVDFQVGTGRMPMARPDTQAPQKPPQFTPQQVQALAAYVASLGPGPAIPNASSYDIANATQQQVVQGGEYFRTNCTACHNFAGSGGALPDGRYAPSLRKVTPKHIFEAMLTGPQQMPVFSDQVITPEAKREIIAYLKNLQQHESYGGLNGGAVGPVSEGLLGWVGGLGALVLVTVWIAAKGTRVKGTSTE
jgi:ubiquinol-cytochrome c reductase cytochrome c subunit